MAYPDKLRDPRWQKKRLEIMERDNWTCQYCGDEAHTLHVHHFFYEQGKDPWEYENKHLITLCEICHEMETEERPSCEQSFLKAMRRAGAPYWDFINLEYHIDELRAWLKKTIDEDDARTIKSLRGKE